jgi:hypothetical protein
MRIEPLGSERNVGTMDDLYLDIVSSLEAGAEPDPAELGRFNALEPGSQRQVVLSAYLLEIEGRHQEAAALLEGFIEAHFASGVARANLARLQWKGGEADKALATLRLALLQDPNQERALHLYAALLEGQSGISGALLGLEGLAGNQGNWLPAWVGAQLAGAREPSQLSRFLLLAARQAGPVFPPNSERLLHLLSLLPSTSQRELAAGLRPFCHQQAQAMLDQLLEQLPHSPGETPTQTAVTFLGRSVWRHLTQPLTRASLGLAPVCLIKPETWGVADIAGRLGRGFSLLLAELLDATVDCQPAVILESHPQAGMIVHNKPLPGNLLASQAGSFGDRLLSSYLSFHPPQDFILDAELYDSAGNYLARESCRALHPGECVEQLAQRLAGGLTALSSGTRPPTPSLSVQDALARDAAASFVLCAEGALSAAALGNSGLLLDTLVAYALQAQNAAALLTLWAAVEAAARADLPGGSAQRESLAEVMSVNAELTFWIDRK